MAQTAEARPCGDIDAGQQRGSNSHNRRRTNSLYHDSSRRHQLCVVSSGKRDSSTMIATCGTAVIARHNVDEANVEERVEEILLAVQSNPRFKDNYIVSSLFLIGAGAFGSVFRVVSQATGPQENPRYPKEYVRYIQRFRHTIKTTRNALVDSNRDDHCLDLVAVKFEQVSAEDIDNNSVGTIHLIREFYILQELFSYQDTRYSMVGFPLPIDFSYIGNSRITKDLNRVIIYDPQGVQNSFKSTYLERNNVLGLDEEDVMDKCYFTMELVGPNLDQWKEFFMDTHGCNSEIVFTVQTTLKLMDQLLCRLLVMHRKNVVHLDLKPDNICMGVGKMCNAVYLIDYGLSKICSDNKPDITLGTRRYMSVGVMNMEASNYIMDIESWFYVLIVLLCDYLPWSDAALSGLLGPDEKVGGAMEEKLLSLVISTKKAFWGDDGFYNRRLIQKVVKKIEMHHKTDVPDVGSIVMDIFEQVRRMRQDFYRVTHIRMNADIRDEESDLFKRYRSLRKLLLFPYNCDFVGKGSCFCNDKDLQRRQEERRAKYKMLTYVESGRNWHWDWDVWFEEDAALEEDTSLDNSPLKLDHHQQQQQQQQQQQHRSDEE